MTVVEAPALEQFLGSTAGLSSATVSRLTSQWSEDHDAFQRRDLSGLDIVHAWADGVHLKVRLDQAKACVLVMVGVRAPHLVALVRAGATFERGVLVEREAATAA